jgi:hypothetical protein
MHRCNRHRVTTAFAGNYRLRGVKQQRMSSGDRKAGRPAKGATQETKKRDPDWATGLKRLYDSVVEEPIPDSFKDLLSKLDSGTK